MKLTAISDDKIREAHQFLSTDALFVLVGNALRRKHRLSVIRMGDGEKSIIEFSHGAPARHFLLDAGWLTEYGLVGADLSLVGNSLMWAADHADYLCPNPAGLIYPAYDIVPLLAKRAQYGEGLFAHTWAYMGRVNELMKYDGGILVVCRGAAHIADALSSKFRVSVTSVEHATWQDHLPALRAIGDSPAHLVLVSAGPAGKELIVEAAERYNKVVIDTGSALRNFWASPSPRNAPLVGFPDRP